MDYKVYQHLPFHAIQNTVMEDIYLYSRLFPRIQDHFWINDESTPLVINKTIETTVKQPEPAIQLTAPQTLNPHAFMLPLTLQDKAPSYPSHQPLWEKAFEASVTLKRCLVMMDQPFNDTPKDYVASQQVLDSPKGEFLKTTLGTIGLRPWYENTPLGYSLAYLYPWHKNTNLTDDNIALSWNAIAEHLTATQCECIIGLGQQVFEWFQRYFITPSQSDIEYAKPFNLKGSAVWFVALPHPETMIKNPIYKKNYWQFLQKIEPLLHA